MSAEQSRHWHYPGARWWKFDFHTHTPASKDYGKGLERASLKQIAPTEWLLGFMRAGVDCVAVTDHNTGAWIDPLKQALRELEGGHQDFRPLHLFPGVEITASGGIHVLAILDPDQGSADVATLLGAVDYHGTKGANDTAANASPINVLESIAKSGAIPILAHVDGPSGAWTLPGNTLKPLLEFAGLYAVEVINPDSPKPDLYRQRRLMCTEVLGSDSHHPTGVVGSSHPGSHYTWVKMAEPSLEGLRLALLDGSGFSIRRSDAPEPFDPFHVPEHFIEAVEVDDARYMGRGERAKVAFNPWLNALVGGRGTGKSTVIHALRLAARRDRELNNFDASSEPRSTFERFNRVPVDRMDRGGLTDQTRVTWTMMRGDVRHRVHWRQDGSGTAVEEETSNATWMPSVAQSVTGERFPVRIFSQGQIAALAGEDQVALLQIIDEAAGVARLQTKLEGTKREFYALRARIREINGKLARWEDLIVERQDVDRKLKRFEEAGHTAILTAYRHRGRQRREADRQFEAVSSAAERIEKVATTLQPDDLPDGLFDETREADRQVAAIMDQLADAMRTAGHDLGDAAQRLRERAASQREGLVEGEWSAASRRAESDYQALVATLNAEGVTDPNEYGRLAQTRQRLDAEQGDLDSMREESDRLIDHSEVLLQQLVEDRRAVSVSRNEFLAKTLAQNDFVRIRNLAYGDDPEVTERSFRGELEAPNHFEKDILVMEGGQATVAASRRCFATCPRPSRNAVPRSKSEFETSRTACNPPATALATSAVFSTITWFGRSIENPSCSTSC